jgi:hypothetical protein
LKGKIILTKGQKKKGKAKRMSAKLKKKSQIRIE